MASTVLLVEDDQACAAALLRVFRRLDAVVDWVGTGGEALARIADGGVDLVVLDLGLPDLDGTLVTRVARVGGYSGGILALTARHGADQPAQALAAGADAFLHKPFLVADLLGRARTLLNEQATGPARTWRGCPTPRA